MAIVAYLRDGKVFPDQEACEAGQDVGSYKIALTDPPQIEARVHGVDYVSTWCWSLDSKKQFGAVPFVVAENRS